MGVATKRARPRNVLKRPLPDGSRYSRRATRRDLQLATKKVFSPAGFGPRPRYHLPIYRAKSVTLVCSSLFSLAAAARANCRNKTARKTRREYPPLACQTALRGTRLVEQMRIFCCPSVVVHIHIHIYARTTRMRFAIVAYASAVYARRENVIIYNEPLFRGFKPQIVPLTKYKSPNLS